ncbi:MAG: hypothetical protein GTN78_22110 [Gemmatimonadales bacterium]|nr:hypothetical protein [Gemmatimonadales bacterium]NIN10853.1 hypothetical protein [Gemmatimonadales bacterium]NIR02861.1 hypothetical protein [Gemmatimonadales bacterium]NIS66495.1 hypothetical protein [Gemmatimonadales bacterium]
MEDRHLIALLAYDALKAAKKRTPEGIQRAVKQAAEILEAAREEERRSMEKRARESIEQEPGGLGGISG